MFLKLNRILWVYKVEEVIKINSNKTLTNDYLKDILYKIINNIIEYIKETDRKADEVDEVIILMAYNIYDKVDSALFLLNNKKIHGVDSIIRSIFESYTNLEFIMKEDTKNRALSFSLSNNYRIEMTLNKYRLQNKDDKYKNKFEGHIAQYIPKREWSEVFKNNGILYPDHWRSIAEFKKGEKIRNFKQLCIYLGDESVQQYDIIYSHLSMETHGSIVKYYNEFLDIDSSVAPKELINKYLYKTVKLLLTFYLKKFPEKASELQALITE